MNLISILLCLLPIKDTLYIFYSKGCPKCEKFFQENLPLLKREFYIKFFNIEIEKNLLKLFEIEDKLNIKPENSIPVFYLPSKETLIYGEKNFLKYFQKIKEKKNIEIWLIYQPNCSKCSRIDKLLKIITKNYPEITLKKIETTSPKGIKILSKIKEGPPILLIGKRIISKENLKYSFIKKAIKEAEIEGLYKPQFEFKESSLPKLGILVVVFAGFLDSINPCAFTLLLFFLSYLLYSGYENKEIIKTTLYFALGIFIAYFLIGIGLGKILLPLGEKLKIFAGVFCLFFALINLYDYINSVKNKKEFINKLPKIFHVIMHRAIKHGINKNFFVWIILSGFTVSIIEFACTGQIYFPTITFLITNQSFKAKYILFLLIYNIMFVSPIMLIGFSLSKINRNKLQNFFQNNLKLIKLTSFLLLGGLAVHFLK